MLHFGYNKERFISRHCLHVFNPYQTPTVWHSCPKVAPKSVASLWPIVQGQLNWRLSQGTRYPKENSNSWNVSEAPTGCEPSTTSSFAEKGAAQHNENIGLWSHLPHVSTSQGCSAEGIGWVSILCLASDVKYSHSWMWTKSEASQRLDWRLEPRPGLGGSLLHDQLLHTWLGAWGCPTWSREVLWALHPSLHPGGKKMKKKERQKE